MSRNYGVNVNNTKKSQQSVETFESKNNAELCKQLGKRTSDLEECRTAIIEKGVEVPEGTDTSEYGDKIREIETGITPTGILEITENGDYDVTEYASAAVNVGSDEDSTLSELIERTITSATISNSVTKIGDHAFAYCILLADVTISNSVTEIGDHAFDNCRSLETVNIPNGVKRVGINAFNECFSLTNVTIPDSVTKLDQFAFNSCDSLTSVTIPNSVTSIGSGAFNNCIGLTSIDIPDSVTSIGGSVFYNCTGLTSITIPDSVTSIGDFAFYGCTGLTSIDIPDSVTSIGNSAFYGCTGLTDIYYTGTQAEWEAIAGISDAGIPETATIHYEYTPT